MMDIGDVVLLHLLSCFKVFLEQKDSRNVREAKDTMVGAQNSCQCGFNIICGLTNIRLEKG